MNPKWHMFHETERKWKILHNTVHKVSVICIYIYNDVHGVLWIHLTLHTCYRAESASSILYCSTDCIFSCFYTCKSRWWLVRILCSVVLFCVILHTQTCILFRPHCKNLTSFQQKWLTWIDWHMIIVALVGFSLLLITQFQIDYKLVSLWNVFPNIEFMNTIAILHTSSLML